MEKSTQTAGQGRNLAIDMLRALTMTLMIFVNDFWKVHDVPQWMEHAKWGVDFMGLADFVYPAFLFSGPPPREPFVLFRRKKRLNTEKRVHLSCAV